MWAFTCSTLILQSPHSFAFPQRMALFQVYFLEPDSPKRLRYVRKSETRGSRIKTRDAPSCGGRFKADECKEPFGRTSQQFGQLYDVKCVYTVQVDSYYKMLCSFFVPTPSIWGSTGPNWMKFCMGPPKGITRVITEGFLDIRSMGPDMGYPLGAVRGAKIFEIFFLDFFIFLQNFIQFGPVDASIEGMGTKKLHSIL